MKNFYKYGIVACILLFILGVPVLINLFNNQKNGERLRFEEQAKKAALEDVDKMANALKIIRGKYTKEVVGRVKKFSDMKIHFNYKDEKYDTTGAIPLPATLSMDIAKALSNQETTISLYSPYPFPNRSNRVLTDFQKKAFKFFENNKESNDPFYEFDLSNGLLKYAIPDKMVSLVCINCHNSWPETPKDNWKLGDVRGAISIVKPFNSSDTVNTSSNFNIYLTIFIMISSAIVLMLFSFLHNRSITEEIKNQTNQIKESEQKLQDEQAKLEETNQVLELKNTLNSRQTDVIKLVQSFDNMELLANELITQLCSNLEASQGGVFQRVRKKGKDIFTMIGSYAHSATKNESLEFELGEGFVGQVAKDGNLLVLSDVPQGYIEVVSGLGKSTPSHLLVAPIKYNEEVLGILELASFKPFTDQDEALFNQISEFIGSKFAMLSK